MSVDTEVEAVVTLEKEEESKVLRGNVTEGLVSAAADPSKFKKFLRFLSFASKRRLLSRGNDRLEDRKTLSVLIDGLESSPDTLHETVVCIVVSILLMLLSPILVVVLVVVAITVVPTGDSAAGIVVMLGILKASLEGKVLIGAEIIMTLLEVVKAEVEVLAVVVVAAEVTPSTNST